jgi:hypothetical protein
MNGGDMRPAALSAPGTNSKDPPSGQSEAILLGCDQMYECDSA